MEYAIAEARDQAAHLAKQVNKLIEDGWKPIGGVAVHSDSGFWWFYQAMVRTSSAPVASGNS
jgi:hypothetical protein